MSNDQAEALRCLEASEHCEGPVEYRQALSSTGKRFPRCDYHWAVRLKIQERHNEAYPDSPVPPAWFDPGYAGERWDEDY